MKKILVVGSTNTDMVISGGAFMMNPGGKGVN